MENGDLAHEYRDEVDKGKSGLDSPTDRLTPGDTKLDRLDSNW